MRVKKTMGRVYGADLSVAEKKAMNMEIQRQLAEYERKHWLEVDAIILWQLHEQFGFGLKRLKKFYDNFAPAMEQLVKRYEMDDSDNVWLCTRLLKEYGVDIEEWRKKRKGA